MATTRQQSYTFLQVRHLASWEEVRLSFKLCILARKYYSKNQKIEMWTEKCKLFYYLFWSREQSWTSPLTHLWHCCIFSCSCSIVWGPHSEMFWVDYLGMFSIADTEHRAVSVAQPAALTPYLSTRWIVFDFSIRFSNNTYSRQV